ncbi:MAG TPA: serine/threonine-protein kinase [Micromonosporaceae bacterium]
MAGRRISDRYELDDLPIARGGMGEVWKGHDVKLDRKVAVKFIRFPQGEPDKELERRFRRESRIAARLEHPGVPAIYDVGIDGERPYLVMQYIEGITVADLTAEHGPLPVGWAAAIAAQSCAVLSVAHRHSLVHRDFKPSNLMLDGDGTVKVLDFGLAVALDATDASQITRTGQTVGTPAYMAPEQIRAGISRPATDLYALGCTLYEMLAGEPVFTGSTTYAVMNKQVDEQPRAIRSVRPDVPVELERLLLDLLRKDPEDRPRDADAVYERLLPFATGLSPLPGVLASPKVPSPVRMYARVVSRIYPGVDATADRRPRAVAAPGVHGVSTGSHVRDEVPKLSRGDLKRARGEAGHLIRQSRYSQAAEALAAVVEPASRIFGPTDTEVANVRLDLANVLFDGGDYRAAAPVYRDLAADLVRSPRADSNEVVLHCRMREATCHALIGETKLALRQLGELVDYGRQHNIDDDQIRELRRQISLLRLAAGQRGAE